MPINLNRSLEAVAVKVGTSEQKYIARAACEAFMILGSPLKYAANNAPITASPDDDIDFFPFRLLLYFLYLYMNL